MVIIQPDNRIIKVEMTIDEANLIVEELERQPHNVYEFLNYNIIIQRFKDALNVVSDGGQK